MTDPSSPERSHLPAQQATEVPQLDALRDEGFVADFELKGDELVVVGQGPVDPRRLHIDRQYRFEGASDPDYESLVLGLHDPETGVRGVLISAYGPAASQAEADVLSILAQNPSCA